jgi:threonine synthase
VDTLVHRTGVTSGDFDYVLRPLCPDCGGTLALQYDETDDGESFLAELTCDACQVAWQASDEDEEDE